MNGKQQEHGVSMGVCFNSLQLTASPDTAQKILNKGFEGCESGDQGVAPQNFSFRPFVTATQPSQVDDYTSELEQIWTNWIDGEPTANQKSQQDKQLTIEFESEDIPPLRTVRAMIAWLEQEQLHFELRYRYRQENETWQGELSASNPNIH